LLVLPRGSLADDAEITFDMAVSDPDAPKDWPILTETSIVGARLASAAKYQGQYLAVHQALTDIPGYGISQEGMLRPFEKRAWMRLDLMRS